MLLTASIKFEFYLLLQFRGLHEQISIEVKSSEVEYISPLLEPDSKDIGKQIKMTESFLEKFGPDIHQWLMNNQRPNYAASAATQRSSAPNQFGSMLRLAGNLYRKLFSNKK